MCDPEAQPYSSDDRFDDPAISSADRLLRHCAPPVQIVPCPINGRKISDQAFKPKKGEAGLSVDLECLLLKEGMDWEARYGAMPHALAMMAVTVADARAHSAGVAWTPKPQTEQVGFAGEANPYHGEIITPISPAQSRAIYRAATVLRSTLAA